MLPPHIGIPYARPARSRAARARSSWAAERTKDALTEVAGEEEAVGARDSERGEEAEVEDAEILGLVDDGEVEDGGGRLREDGRDRGE